MTSSKTSQAIAALRRDAKPSLDPEAFLIVKADVLAFYGWTWPAHLDLVEGGKALFKFLIEKHSAREGP